MEQRTVLEAFARAMTRETHNLLQRPDLIRQQLTNRLQWEEEAVSRALPRDAASTRERDRAPWMRTTQPWRESPRLVRTLQCLASVKDCRISPDGRFILSNDDLGSLSVWEIDTGSEIAGTGVADFLVSPDGTLIKIGRGGVEVLDLPSLSHLANFDGHTGAVSDDGKLLVADSTFSRSWHTVLDVWDRTTGRRIASQHPRGFVNRCAMSPSGDLVAFELPNGRLRIWRAARTRRLGIRKRALRHRELVDFAISRDGSLVLAVNHEGTLVVWDVLRTTKRIALSTAIKPRASTPQFAGLILERDCAITPDGRHLLGVSAGDGLKVWDLATGEERLTFGDDKTEINACAISPDGSWALTAKGATLKVWDMLSGEERMTLEGHGATVNACCIHPDGKRVVSASADTTVKIWDVAIRGDRIEHTARGRGLRFVAICGDGQSVVSGASTVRGWHADVPDELEKHLAQVGHESRVHAISRDGAILVVTTPEAELKVWDLETCEERMSLEQAPWGERCAVSPDGAFIVAGGRTGRELTIHRTDTADVPKIIEGNRCVISPDSKVIVTTTSAGLAVYEAATGEECARFGDERFDRCAISPDGSYVVAAFEDRLFHHVNLLRVWDLGTQRERAPLKADGPEGVNSEFEDWIISPDSRFILSAPRGNVANLAIWDVESAVRRDNLLGQGFTMYAFAVTRDGNHIVSGGDDHTLRVWDVADGTEKASLNVGAIINRVALHPSLPFVAVDTGTVFVIELMNVPIGPIGGSTIERRSSPGH